jgi:hypothetical protein
VGNEDAEAGFEVVSLFVSLSEDVPPLKFTSPRQVAGFSKGRKDL